MYMQDDYKGALALCDSIIGSGMVSKACPDLANSFYGDYAEILDGAGYPTRAIAVIDSLNRTGIQVNKVENAVTLALFYANSGHHEKAKALLDSINIGATQSVPEIYVGLSMLKIALLYDESGKIPSGLLHEVSKTMQRTYHFAQFDRQTAMESIIELNDANYELNFGYIAGNEEKSRF